MTYRQNTDNYTHKHTLVAVSVILRPSCAPAAMEALSGKRDVGFQTPGQSEGLGLGRTLSPWDSPPASFYSMEEHHATANHQLKTTSGAQSQATIRRQHISL